MNRNLDSVLVQARDGIERLLDKYGFRLVSETFHHEAFGSAQLEYRHRAHCLRLNWDGKDRYLWLTGAISPDQHTEPGTGRWRALDSPSPPGTPGITLRPGEVTDARIDELLAQIELFRKSKAAV